MPRRAPDRFPLNPEQRAAVRHLDGPLLVLAGAGSGKTRVITAKLAQLVERGGYAPGEIAAVTFTNKAAREMRARAVRLLGERRAEGLQVSTFHLLGLRLLRDEASRLGYRRGFSIFDAEDQRNLLTELLKAERLDRDEVIERVHWRIQGWKSALVDPEAALAGASDALDVQAAAAYGAYQRHLLAYNAVDFDDLIMQPVRLLENDAMVRERWQARVRYLLVDEYQDTNGAQYRMLKALVGARGAFTVVGDDDQSIYAWRGARPEGLGELAADFPALTVIKLEQNYRSTDRILRAANALIAHNPHLFAKALRSTQGEGEPVRVMACTDGEHEIEWVVSELLARRHGGGARWGDFAILYRGNHQARVFEQKLREHKIAYRLSGGTSFFDRAEVRDLASYLRLAANPHDDAALLRVVNVPRRELGAATMEKLGAWARRRQAPLFECLTDLGLAAEVGPRAAERLAAFERLIVELGEQGDDDPAGALAALIGRVDYHDWLRELSRDDQAADKRIANVEEFAAWLAAVARDAGDKASLADVVARMSLLDLLEREDDAEAGDRVQLMTLHAAKGLEFPHVYLVGFEEDVLPHRNAIEGGTIEEERRLAYVGITRARATLTITHAAARKRHGELRPCTPSRFLAELPQDELVAVGEPPKSVEEKLDRGRSKLASLRALLASGEA